MPAGMTVTPGFIDTHCHLSGVNELYGVNANVRRVRELQANLRAKADKTPPGQWVSGFMFDDTKLDVPADTPASRRGVDASTRSSSTTAADTRAGTTPRRSSWPASRRTRPIPITAGSSATRHGELTGRVAELARNVFNKVGTRETFTPEQQRERGRNGMRHISELLTAAGLTSVHDAGADRDRILRLRGRARQRRAAPSRVLHDPRQRDVRRLQGRRHLQRLRRRVDPRRRREVRAPTARRPSARCA